MNVHAFVWDYADEQIDSFDAIVVATDEVKINITFDGRVTCTKTYSDPRGWKPTQLWKRVLGDSSSAGADRGSEPGTT